MNDMLGNEIKEDDIVLYDGQVCKVVTSTAHQIKYVHNVRYDGELYEHGTTMNTKVLKLNDFDITKVAEQEALLPVAAREYVKPSKRPLSIEEQGRVKAERDRRNALKKQTKQFDIIQTNGYDNLVYLGHHNITRDEVTEMLHVYCYAGYNYNNPDLIDSILNPIPNSTRSYTLVYQKSKKQPTSIISNNRNEELKQHFKNLQVPIGRNSYYASNYIRITEILKDT